MAGHGGHGPEGEISVNFQNIQCTFYISIIRTQVLYIYGKNIAKTNHYLIDDD